MCTAIYGLFCPSSSPQICVLIAESNGVHASLKKKPMLSVPCVPPLRRTLIIIIRGEIRALTSNLSSDSIAKATARNIAIELLSPAACCGVSPSQNDLKANVCVTEPTRLKAAEQS